MRRLKDKDKEYEYLKRYSFGANLTKVLVALIQFGTIGLIFYFLRDMVHDLAGKETTANINVSIFDKALSALFGGGGVLYGYKQKKLRKETTEHLQNRIIQLESAIDPNRSSSGLTSVGNTNPEDL